MNDPKTVFIGNLIGLFIGFCIVNPLSAILFGFPALNKIVQHFGGNALELNWFLVGLLGFIWQLPVSVLLWIISLAV